MAFLYAYLRTTYVKIGGRIYTYTLFRNRPDPPLDGFPPPPLPAPPVDAYGNVLTAPKLWWTITAFSVAAGALATSQGRTAVTIAGGAVVVVLLALVGYVDAREGFPICRGQHVQLALTAIVSIPLFLLPPLAYAATYWGAGGRHHSDHR
ncbi:MAG: hypothetical protein ACRDUX_16220 [Mycobacterium sp.]